MFQTLARLCMMWKKWMGFALCSAFMDHQHKQLKIGVVSFLVCLKQKCQVSSIFSIMVRSVTIYLWYLRRATFPEGFTQSSWICTYFATDYSSGVQVRICGLHMVYQQDSQGLVQTPRCTAYIPSLSILMNIPSLEEDWINWIALPSPEVSQETNSLSNIPSP